MTQPVHPDAAGKVPSAVDFGNRSQIVGETMWKFLQGFFRAQDKSEPISAPPAQSPPHQASAHLEGGLEPEPTAEPQVEFSGASLSSEVHWAGVDLSPLPGGVIVPGIVYEHRSESELLDLLGERGYVSAADIDPEGCQQTGDYFLAERLARAGEVAAALEILGKLCSKPNIYKGHYRLLFRLHRQLNKDDLKAGAFVAVMERVLDMIRKDDEMIGTMLSYWSKVQRRKLGPHYFDRDRNLKVSDAKALLTAEEALKDRKSASQAKTMIERFERI